MGGRYQIGIPGRNDRNPHLGYGTPKDPKQSYYWELLAAQIGEQFYKSGLALKEKYLSSSDVEEMRRLAETWQPVLEYRVPASQSLQSTAKPEPSLPTSR